VKAVSELWPLITRLEARLSGGYAEPEAVRLLVQARVSLGVALGHLLPEELMATAARWTGRALRRQPLLLARWVAALTRLWQRVEQNRFPRLGEVSMYTRSQGSAWQMPRRPARSEPMAIPRPAAMPAPQPTTMLVSRPWK
jgi:hypothetical protein